MKGLSQAWQSGFCSTPGAAGGELQGGDGRSEVLPGLCPALQGTRPSPNLILTTVLGAEGHCPFHTKSVGWGLGGVICQREETFPG